MAAPGLVTGAPVLVLMGVSGSGKSTVAGLLAGRLGWDLEEGDDLHPAANVAKMARRASADRRGPLALAGQHRRAGSGQHTDAGRPGIVTCSALKKRYRDVLRGDRRRLRLPRRHARADRRPAGRPARPLHAGGAARLAVRDARTAHAGRERASPSTSPVRRPSEADRVIHRLQLVSTGRTLERTEGVRCAQPADARRRSAAVDRLTTPGCWWSPPSASPLIVVLIAKFKLHPFLALDPRLRVRRPGLRRRSWPRSSPTSRTGVGGVLKEVGLLIALGAMLGKLLADSGGADRVVDTLLAKAPARGALGDGAGRGDHRPADVLRDRPGAAAAGDRAGHASAPDCR